MKRYALWLLALVLGAGGCIELDNPQAMTILNNTFVSTRTQCQVRAGATEFRARGVMDIAVTNTYYMYPQVENTFPNSGDLTLFGPEQLRLNNNSITLLGVEVNFDYDVTSDIAYEVFFEDYQGQFILGSGTIRPGETAPTVVPIIPWDLGNELASAPSLQTLGGAGVELNVRVVAVGVLNDHTEVRSNEFWYPLTVCNGCLVYFPPNVDPRRLEENVSVPCALGQDDGVDARLCYTYVAAPATSPGGISGDSIELLNRSRDRCRWLHILSGTNPPDSQYYWDRYKEIFANNPLIDRPGGLDGWYYDWLKDNPPTQEGGDAG